MQTDAQRFFEERNVIKANPLITTLRTTCFMLFFIVIIFLAILILFFVLDTIFGGGKFLLSRNSTFPLYLFTVAINSFNLTMNVRQLRYWKRIEQQRFAAIQGNQTLLAAEQPARRAAPMWLPGTLKLCRTKSSWLLMAGGVLLMVLLMAGVFGFDSPFFTSNRLLFFLVCFCILAIMFLALLFILFHFVDGQKIEPTEYGLTTGKNTTVIWSEARLFAFYNTFGLQESGSSITYELSSARGIIRWVWVQRRARFAAQEPIAPQDEYNSQMQGLLALVQARTGLPLYDLRQQRVSLPEDGPDHPLANS